jgi:nucleoside-diphosphate-sugar epimerase
MAPPAVGSSLNNLIGTLNLLEYAKRHGSGVVMLGTNRVIKPLCVVAGRDP